MSWKRTTAAPDSAKAIIQRYDTVLSEGLVGGLSLKRVDTGH